MLICNPIRLDTLASTTPKTREQLAHWVKALLGLDVPGVALMPGSTPPLDYLAHSFFEQPGDAVVWANRGGGKTMLGAVATMLDLIFKPSIQVRVLGGSMEQSRKMHEHMLTLLERRSLGSLGGLLSGDTILAGVPTRTRIELINGSRVELLAQSHRSVRGTRVHKLRCDEVDEFEPDVWQAAQMVTRSGRCGRHDVRGTIEALSTMHRPFGMMTKLAPQTNDAGGPVKPTSGGARVFRWSAVDVMQRCDADRRCDACVLHPDCRGAGKRAAGFIPVDDLVAQWHRTDRATWDAEMMCRRPSVSDNVYPGFDPTAHVNTQSFADEHGGETTWLAGMDFGTRSPTVWLWAQLTMRDGRPHVDIVNEHYRRGLILDTHLDLIESHAAAQGYPPPDWIAVDPAGRARNGQTGLSDTDVLRARGYRVKSCTSRIADGIRLVRRHLDHHTLRIHPRCEQLIESLQRYHFDTAHPQREEPIKDGHDHACDALRYLLVNLEREEAPTEATMYW